MKIEEKKPRSYWHVDAKWIFGIIFAISLAVSLFSYNLVAITEEKPAVDALTLVLASMYSQNGLNDKTEIDQMRAKIEANPNGVFQPIPNVDITIKLSDLDGLSPQQIRLNFFRKLAQPIYTGNTDSLTTNPEQRKAFLNDTKLIRTFVSAETHQTLQTVFLVFAILSVICLIPFVFFSYRFGRLVSPGLVLVFDSFLGVVIFAFATTIHPPTVTPGSADSGPLGAVGPMISPLIPEIAQIFLKTYLIAFGIGVVLLVSALICKIIYRIKTKETKPQPKKKIIEIHQVRD